MQKQARFFETPAALRAWLQKNHRKAAELQVGYFKRGTGKASVTWPESVAEALCFGWVDGVRRRLEDDRYVIRFTPRKPGSTWSAVNIRMIAELEAAGRMTEAGRAAFEARREAKSKVYSYEQKEVSLDETRIREFKKNPTAWAFFADQPPSYRKKVSWWVMSAKQEETRKKRLKRLLDSSAAGRRLT